MEGWCDVGHQYFCLFVNCFYLNILDKVRTFDWKCQDRASCGLSGNPANMLLELSGDFG